MYALGAAPESILIEQLDQPDEHLRAWGVRLLIDGQTPSGNVAQRLAVRAETESSGLVLLYMAAALQKLDLQVARRWPLARALVQKSDLADDPVFPLMLWYGLEPLLAEDPNLAVLATTVNRLPLIAQFIARA